MSDDSPAPDAAVKPKRIRDHAKEYKARRQAKRKLYNQNQLDAGEIEPPPAGEEELHHQLRLLEQRTRHNPTDADGDIDFAYRNMANSTVVKRGTTNCCGSRIPQIRRLRRAAT